VLADGEDEGIVEGNVGALRLCDVQVVALCVRCRVERQERVWRVGAGMGDGQPQSESMRVELVGVLLFVSRYFYIKVRDAHH
jgi:hypothetical protein